MQLLNSPTAALLATALLGLDPAAAATASSSSASTSAAASAGASAPTGATYASNFDITTSWGNLSPYTDSPGFDVPNGVPHGCELAQVHILHRHAQRYPTSSDLDGLGMQKFAQKLKNYTALHPHRTLARGPLAFLNDWEYMMGEDTLLGSGAATEATSGADAWGRYGRLLYRTGAGVVRWEDGLNVYPNGTRRAKPVFRTTSQARILESARWWLSGFFGNSGANSSYSQYDLVVIPEVDPFNNTLASYDSCPGDSREGYQGDTAAESFLPALTHSAISRLSPYLPHDFHLTTSDILAMLNMCPYEYATYSTHPSPSPFCTLFTEQEWKDYEYILDLQFYGNYGFGASTGRAQGIGYILELAARLQSNLITSSDTSINYTYDNNEKTFPLGQPLYMDMSHDDIIVSVLTALGLEYFKYGPAGLPAANITHAPANRTFNLNKLTPFGARLNTEVWSCPSPASIGHLDPVLYSNPDLSTRNTTEYIRFMLNNAPVPLDGLKGCEKGVNGFCAVGDFVAAVPGLKRDAEYQFACFGKYDAGGRQVGDGKPE